MDLIEGDDTVFEKYPLAEAARMGQLNAYRHKEDSGSAWTPFVKKISWKVSGRAEMHRGRSGNRKEEITDESNKLRLLRELIITMTKKVKVITAM